MAQIVEVIGVGPVEFPDGMSKEEMAEALKKLPKPAAPQPETTMKPTPQQIERAVKAPAAPPAPVISEGGAAFVAPRQRATALKEVQAAAIEERNRPKFSWQDLTTNEDLQNIQKDLLRIRGNVDTTNMSGEEVAKKFMSTMREDDWNTISFVGSLNTLRNANMDNKTKLEYGKQLFEQTASALEKEGQPGAAPYLDIAKAVFTDWTNYISLGVGAAGRKLIQPAAKKEFARMLGTETIEEEAKSKLGKIAASTYAKAMTPTAGKVVGATTATEAAIGAGVEGLSQKEQQERAMIRGEEPEQMDYTKVAAMSIFSGMFGAVEGKGALAIKPGKSGSEKLNEILQSKKIVPDDPNAPQTPAERVLTDSVTENMDKVVEEFMNIQGGRILDDVNPATALTDAKIQKELSGRAVRVALHVMQTDPSFRVKPNQKTSMAIAEVFSNLDKVDDAVLEQAIRKEGLTPEEFAQANKLTVTEAAQVMQQYSAAAKAMQRLSQIDPEFAKRAELLFGKPDEVAEGTGFFERVRQVEAESKSWITSGIDTTVRNVYGTTIGMPFKSAAAIVEAIPYVIGKTIKAGLDPKSSGIDTFKKSMADTIHDAFSVYGYLLKSDIAAETTDVLLQHNPAIRAQILSATQESSTREMSKAARLFNSLNVAQDAFFRRAIFTATVEQNMRKIGLDMYEVLAKGQVIPPDVLKNAAEVTLKSTFSYTPKAKGIGSFENVAETAGNVFVKAAELPFGSLFATFPRYITNAIAFQYRYSPLGMIEPVTKDLASNAAKAMKGDEAAMVAVQQANAKIAKSIVGTAALYAAYEYRLANQDTDWNMLKNDDGTTTDARPLGVIASYLGVGDWLAKRQLGIEPDTKGIMEQIVGLKMAGGTQGYFVDKVFNAFSSEKEATAIETDIGRTAGDAASRFTQPFVVKSIYQLFDIFREEGAVARDPNIVEAEGSLERIGQTAAQRVQARLPVVKEDLPEAVVRLQEGPAYREGEFFYSLVGVRDVPNKTPEEKEIKRLGIDPYRLYGPSSGDRVYDRAFVKEANQHVTEAIRQTMERPDYQNLPELEQKAKLQKIVSKALEVPKQNVAATMTAEDFDRVQKMRFNKLPKDERNIINRRYAEENNGVTLEEANDYTAMDEYFARFVEPLKYALGGFVGKTGAKKTGKAAAGNLLDTIKTAPKKKTPVSKQISDIVDQELAAPVETPTPSPAIDQMSSILQGKPAPAPVKKPAPKVKKAPVVEQTEEVLATPSPATKTADNADIEQYADDFFDDVDDVYNEDPTLGMSYNFDELSPIDPANVGKGVVGTPIDKFTSIGGIDGAISIVRKERTDAFDKLRGDPDFLDYDDSVLSTALAKYREKYSETLADDMALPKDRRSPFYAPEFDIEEAGPKQFETFLKIADAEQKKLDSLRKKYAGRPPVTLFHGQEEGSKVMQELTKKGFASPQIDPRKHAELSLGAPSFTKDPNLNTLIPKFGGQDVGAYGSVNVPYADYMYRRVNMPASTYDLANRSRGGDPLEALSLYNRAISGTDDNAVPISLPKNYHLESEDMFIEADKLKKMGFSRPAAKGGDPVAREQIVKAISESDITTANLKKIGESYDKFIDGVQNKKVSEKDIYNMYNNIRTLFKQEINRPAGSVSVTGGAGSRYVNTMRTLAEGQDLVVPSNIEDQLSIITVLSELQREMEKLAGRKGNKVLTEKANNIAQLRDLLINIREQTTNKIGDVTPSSVKAVGYSKGKIPESKMPLANAVKDLEKQKEKLQKKIATEWEEDVIDNLKQQIDDIDDDIAAKKKAIGPIESERTSKDKIMKLTDKLAKGGFVSKRR